MKSRVFRSLVADGTIFDPVGVHCLYGILLAKLVAALEQNQDILVHLAVASAFRLKRVIPKATIVLIQPPSKDAAEARLLRRGMTQDSIARRRADEPEHDSTDYVYDLMLVNENDKSQKTATEILTYLAQLQKCAL